MSETKHSSLPTDITGDETAQAGAVWLKRLMPLWGFLLFGIALWLLHRELADYHIDDISDALFSINSSTVIRTLILTVLGYAVLAYYDVLALRTMKKNLKLGQMMLASFTGFAVSNSTGHALIAGGSLRYRFYSNWGIGALDVAKISLYSTFTYFLGVAVLWLSTTPVSMPGSVIPTAPVTLLASAILLAYLGWVYSARPIRLKDFELSPPNFKLAGVQIILGTLDALLTVTILYLLVNAYADVSWIELVRAYILAQLAGLFSQVPGGIGVFEGGFIALMPNTIEPHQLISALVLFRIIYYFLPLMAAGVGLVLYEARQSKLMQRRVTRQTLSVVRASIPRIYALLMVMASIVLLVSGVTPADEDRLDWLLDLLPLPIMEFSHLIGSVVGFLALFVARAVFLRIDSAYYAAIAMLVAGIVASLLKGFDYEEASALSVMLILFLPTKKFFYRKSALLQLHFPAAWWLLILLVVAGATWLGFFSYRHVEYADELWWQFSWEGDASRFLRSTLGMAVVGLSFLAYRIIV
ncbi:MAG TPA: lysylphosphatidylglycerol synthase domain-containing protein, partial [Pseudomonadales bacterium]|nr:lysylphosphatidylglycerol synthase domain-containing protein [Pseudomonadales bacterium]